MRTSLTWKRIRRVAASYTRLLRDAAGLRGPASRAGLRMLRQDRKAPLPAVAQPTRAHLNEAIAWIARGQDAIGTGGVSWGYRTRGLDLGWERPYPETTGYIIPTLLRCSSLLENAAAEERAARMLRWLLSIQLPDGGFQGGIYGDADPASSTFVTGQVLFGITAWYRQFEGQDTLEAGCRAADYLLSCLDQDGRFIRGHSRYCAPGPKTYEVRTGLALVEFGTAISRPVYVQAGLRMANFALSQQRPNAWFDLNDLNFPDRPLTHTIGYTLEGLHGIGTAMARADCIAAVDSALRALLPLIRPDGHLPGRLGAAWEPRADWACLTGSAQVAGVFLRRYRQTQDATFLDAGRRLLAFVAATQESTPELPGLRGGIRGSYPFDGGYVPFCFPNWAAKFFADSTMDFLEIAASTEAKQAGA